MGGNTLRLHILGYGMFEPKKLKDKLNEMIIENFKGIIKYHPELIIIQCKNYQVNIIGDNLIIEMYTKEEVKVIGTIFEIKFS